MTKKNLFDFNPKSRKKSSYHKNNVNIIKSYPLAHKWNYIYGFLYGAWSFQKDIVTTFFSHRWIFHYSNSSRVTNKPH